MKVTRIATAGLELADGYALDATYAGDDADITTGLPIDGLLDVNAPAPSNGDVLTWDSTPGEWIAQAPTAGVTPTATVTDETTFGITPAVGVSTAYARGDHTHGTPTAPAAGGGELLITDTPAGSPLVFADLLQNDAGDDLLYADA